MSQRGRTTTLQKKWEIWMRSRQKCPTIAHAMDLSVYTVRKWRRWMGGGGVH